ncbi:ArsR/SmtB family transcription factor [Pseudobacteroides cellulosolvens]|uniref:Transcriptional regulator, ArsR family n=1 Tax=Pseudobacteroides cellulosolvens ATCC 35603 = DSM 2933 TaxID=398512 RepID=A0A0L6JU67_9FIRM|nr:metalloregulator ArsR/SmtB family transcription factor [Pseudobacteroides cellulosolvens]KNY29401.1 transcriptional regulator, ArsR family [Pseudobacteroides cellulosolvens ATCC 35603 = DSM 2933]
MDDLLNLFGILSDKTRLRILLLLMDKELCVCEIFAALHMSQPRVSRQLAILKQSKIIKDRREGKWIYYRIDQNDYTKKLMSIISLLPEWLSDDPEFNNDKSMLNKIPSMKNKLSSCQCVTAGGEKNG